MNINRPLMPGFLKRAEQKLLLNKPLIWSTRVHLVLYYGILYNLFLAGLCFLAPLDLRERSNTEYWVGFQVIIAIIALTVWLIYLLRFNVFKQYGNIKPLHALVTFLLYFISTGIIILSVYIYPVVECVRANRAFSNKELLQDINNINIKICQVEHNVLNRKWEYDTLAVVKGLKAQEDSLSSKNHGIDYDTVTFVPPGPGVHAFYKVDPADLKDRLAQEDSVSRLNDTMYLTYRTPDLIFVSSYSLEEHIIKKTFNSFEIYNRALKHPPTPAEVRTIAKELNELERKYVDFNKADDTMFDDEIKPDDGPFAIVEKRHPVGRINNSISHIASKKFSFSERHLAEYIRLFYYFTLGITLLIFIFRHTTVRAFFLSLLAGILLLILTTLVLNFSHADNIAIMSWMICYALLFFVGSIFTFSSAKRSVLNGILINVFVFMAPVFPLLVFGLFYAWKEKRYYEMYQTQEGFHLEPYIPYAEIAGLVLFLLLLATYINKLYRRWYSLPEN